MVVMVPLIAVVGFVIAYCTDEPAYAIGFGIAAVLCVLVTIYTAIHIKILGNYAQKGLFYIKEDICERKKHKVSSVSNPAPNVDYYYLYFRENGKISLTFPYANFLTTDSNLFEASNEGDRFYILFIGKKKIIYVFNSKEWTLDSHSFIKDGDVYRPRMPLD